MGDQNERIQEGGGRTVTFVLGGGKRKGEGPTGKDQKTGTGSKERMRSRLA